jgi:hypothetical protein
VEEGDIDTEEYRAAVAPSTADASPQALPDVKHEAYLSLFFSSASLFNLVYKKKKKSVHVAVEEKLTAVISNDGGLQSFDVVGGI